MSHWAKIKRLTGLHSFLETLKENPFLGSLAHGPLSSSSKPEILHLSDHLSVVPFPLSLNSTEKSSPIKKPR